MIACLCNLALGDENKYEIVKAGALPPLISLSQSSDMQAASQACATLANLAEVRDTMMNCVCACVYAVDR